MPPCGNWHSERFPRPAPNATFMNPWRIRSGACAYTLLLYGAAREVVAKEQDSDIGSDD